MGHPLGCVGGRVESYISSALKLPVCLQVSLTRRTWRVLQELVRPISSWKWLNNSPFPGHAKETVMTSDFLMNPQIGKLIKELELTFLEIPGSLSTLPHEKKGCWPARVSWLPVPLFDACLFPLCFSTAATGKEAADYHMSLISVERIRNPPTWRIDLICRQDVHIIAAKFITFPGTQINLASSPTHVTHQPTNRADRIDEYDTTKVGDASSTSCGALRLRYQWGWQSVCRTGESISEENNTFLVINTKSPRAPSPAPPAPQHGLAF